MLGIFARMDECLGLLVTHEDGRVECLDPDCVDGDRLRHEWLARCADIPGLCRCARPDVERQRRAA
jgi:hypothetical protein